MLACEQALLFGRVKRVSRERASERRSRAGQRKACSQATSMLNLYACFSVVIIFARTPVVAWRNVGCFLRQTCTWNIALSRFFSSPRISYLVTCLYWRPPTVQTPWIQPSADPGDWTERLRSASLMLLIVRIFWERFWGLWHIASRRRNLPGNK